MMPNMQTPLSPLDFARRTRRLHGAREAVVDGSLRLTYEQFFDRCDRWSAALQGLGVRQGDRVATIAPNTHAQLESFYAVPQLGAVLVPVNYRLTPDDFVYIVNHSGSTVVCVHSDYLADVNAVRDQMPGVRHFVAFEGTRDGWLDYEAAIAAAEPRFTRPEIGELDLLTINYTSGTTARPKGVMITHRNAAMNTIGTLLHLPIAVGERYLWTLPMFHANGWTYTWTVTAAAGTHVCLRKVDPATVFRLIRDEHVALLCAAPTVLISLANAPAETRGHVVPGVRVITAGAPPAAATIERLEGEFGWEVTHVYGLTETAPFITCAAAPTSPASNSPAGCSRMRPTAQRRASARLATTPATISASTVARSAGPSSVATRANSGELSIGSGGFPSHLMPPQFGLVGAARRSGVSGTNSIHAVAGSSPACSLSTPSLLASAHSCRVSRLSQSSSGLPARSMKTRIAVSPGSTPGSSPYPRTSTRANVPAGKNDNRRLRSESDSALSTGAT